MKEILLVSDDGELIQKLETVITFMGEACYGQSFADSYGYLNTHTVEAVMIDYARADQVQTILLGFGFWEPIACAK